METRKFKNLFEAPDDVRKMLQHAIGQVLINYPSATQISLTGDFADGTYSYEGMPDEERRKVAAIKNNAANSRIELYIYPNISEQVVSIDGTNIDIVPASGATTLTLLSMDNVTKVEAKASAPKAQWDFTKLNEAQKQLVAQKAQAKDWENLALFLRDTTVLPNGICTCNYTSLTKKWTEWAIHEKIIEQL